MLVALSASYGSAGGHIGPLVADRLGVPFVDRVIPMAVAQRLEVPLSDAVAYDERGVSWLERMLSSFVAADTGAAAPVVAETFSPEEFRRATEEVIAQQAATGEGVILGRGAVALLKDDPRVLRVRLDGPPERRMRQARRLHPEMSEEETRRALQRLDRTHADYLRHFYGADITDARLYHLVIDSTSLELDACAELIVLAVREPSADRRLARRP